eukprot:scaffold363_cov331-Pavlova_lutheri.AAC.37
MGMIHPEAAAVLPRSNFPLDRNVPSGISFGAIGDPPGALFGICRRGGTGACCRSSAGLEHIRRNRASWMDVAGQCSSASPFGGGRRLAHVLHHTRLRYQQGTRSVCHREASLCGSPEHA